MNFHPCGATVPVVLQHFDSTHIIFLSSRPHLSSGFQTRSKPVVRSVVRANPNCVRGLRGVARRICNRTFQRVLETFSQLFLTSRRQSDESAAFDDCMRSALSRSLGGGKLSIRVFSEAAANSSERCFREPFPGHEHGPNVATSFLAFVRNVRQSRLPDLNRLSRPPKLTDQHRCRHRKS